MPPTTSRLKAIETRLTASIEALALAGFTVDRGHPAKNLTKKHVWINLVYFDERPGPHTAPAYKRDQDITAEIIVRVSTDGNDAATLRDLVYDTAQSIEDALRIDPGLSDDVLYGGVVRGAIDSFTDTDGRVAAIQLDAQYLARNTG